MDDGVPQEEVEQIIALDHVNSSEFIQGFHDERAKTIKLSTLRSDFEKKRTRTSTQRLQQRHTVEVDEEFLYVKDNPRLAWGAKEHFLDYYLLVPASKGLHVLLPTSRGDPSYVFKLDLNKRTKRWQARYSDLEFDPTGRMLYIGSYHQEEVWLAMVPRSFTDEETLEDGHDLDHIRSQISQLESRDTTLSEENYCQVVTFLAHQLKSQGYRDIYLRDDFPSPLSFATVFTTTNIL